jgi:16S rRNA (cytosine1402-N4)-methyltransferase
LDTDAVYHVPVLVQEVLDALAIKPDGIYVDATVGGGGHFKEIIARLNKKGTAVGIDRDPEAIEWCRAHTGAGEARVILQQCEFSRFDTVLEQYGMSKIDGLLLDLGVSSRQIDSQKRGFSYMKQTDLDMRMDPTSGISAAQFCSETSEQGLATVLSSYGEITNPLRMARAIKKCQSARTLCTSGDLVQCLRGEYGQGFPIKVLARVFQALRIVVNRELDELSTCLEKALSYVKTGGRIVVISYHSLEDRIVKNFFRDKEQACSCPKVLPRCICGNKALLKRINKKVVVPSAGEIQSNLRARSAKFRAAEKVA